MVAEVNNPVGPSVAQNTPAPQASSNGVNNAPQANVPKVPQGNSSGDTVSLSARALKPSGFVENFAQSGQGANPTTAVRDVTDDNRFVVKFIDQDTNEVVRQIPSEDLLRLKQAVSNLVEQSRPDDA